MNRLNSRSYSEDEEDDVSIVANQQPNQDNESTVESIVQTLVNMGYLREKAEEAARSVKQLYN